jgi:hypothetical protein
MENLKIDIKFEQILGVVKFLTPDEKLKLNEEIWLDDFEIPFEHQEIVLGRIAKSKADHSRLLDWKDVESKLNS